MPALSSAASTFPQRLTVSSTSFFTAASSVTSVGQVAALAPISLATSASGSTSTSASISLAPSAAMSRAAAAPMPRAAPVMITTLPSIRPMLVLPETFAVEARRDDHARGRVRQFLPPPPPGLCSGPDNECARIPALPLEEAP
jgi:hypothetical protein